MHITAICKKFVSIICGLILHQCFGNGCVTVIKIKYIFSINLRRKRKSKNYIPVYKICI